MRDVKPFVDALFDAIKSYVARSIGAVAKRVDALDTTIKALPPPIDEPSLIERAANAAAALVPKPQDGHSVTVAELEPVIASEVARMVARAVEALPKPADGKSVTPDELRPVIAELVLLGIDKELASREAKVMPQKPIAQVEVDVEARLRAFVAEMVGALPPAPPGRDADPEVVRGMVKEAVAAAVAALPPASPGKDADMSVVAKMVADAVAAIPRPAAGKDADPDLMRAEIAKLVTAIPKPQDGKSVTAEEVAPILQQSLEGLFAKWALDVERRFNDQAQRAIENIPKPKDGVDGFSLEDLEIEHDGERTLTLRFKSGHLVREKSFRIDSLIDRGVWREGTYEKGDGVTWAGSFWIAQRSTQSKPQTDDSWRLAVKKGRDA